MKIEQCLYSSKLCLIKPSESLLSFMFFAANNISTAEANSAAANSLRTKQHLSGLNFLSGKTPFKNFPMFPDVSKIYQPIKGLNGVIVHTVGPKRFRESGKNKEIISESVALIAPIWYYIGVRVSAKGIPYN